MAKFKHRKRKWQKKGRLKKTRESNSTGGGADRSRGDSSLPEEAFLNPHLN